MTRAERIHLAIYREMCREVEAEHGRLFSSPTHQGSSIVNRWSEVWAFAFDHRSRLLLSAGDLFKSGRLLFRVSESYTAYEIADRIVDFLDTLVQESDPNGLEMAEILTDAGELDRRLGRPDRATERCDRALKIASLQGTAAAHELLSRIFYELAYIEFYAGNAEAALQKLARSREEADIAGDAVGAGIARALSAAIRVEEGVLDGPLDALRAEATRFAALAESDELNPRRRMFANRWRVNCDIHAMQAVLAAGDAERARRAYDEYVKRDPSPSRHGNATLLFTGACIVLAQGDLDDAADLAGGCREATPLPFETQEAAAAITSLYGVISLARGDAEHAWDAFNEANALNPALRNARGQGWAALGLAVLAIDAGNSIKAVEAVNIGINACERCCAPVRHALAKLRAELAAGTPQSAHNWKRILQALTGPLPKLLPTDSEPQN